MSRTIQRWRLRAPEQHGATLIEPPLAAVEELLARNRHVLSERNCEIGGRSLAELSREARGEAYQAAVAFTRQLRDVADSSTAGNAPFILSGHQPQLYHPGVWFKNFVVDFLRRRHKAVGINLIVDSDAMRSCAIRVPTGPVSQPRSESVAFDRPTAEFPYEERQIQDVAQFGSFAVRVKHVLGDLGENPLIQWLWPGVVANAERYGRPGMAIAAGRLQTEAEIGLANLELPLSHICRTGSFLRFAAHLLKYLPQLREQYNAALAEYRRVYRVKNAAQPLPDLASHGDWLEAPLWIWSEEDPQRRRLFIRHSGSGIELSDREMFHVKHSPPAECGFESLVEYLSHLADRGVKIRPRALTTTMYARLLLSDLFIHGIGGARYDQVTDRVIEAFFGLTPPSYVAATATFHLPVEREPVSEEEDRRLAHLLRELKFNPDRHLKVDDVADSDRRRSAEDAIEQKRRWIRTAKTPENAAHRHHKIVAANEALQPFVEPQRNELQQQGEQIHARLRAEAILASREYAFCLHPQETLSNLILEKLRKTS